MTTIAAIRPDEWNFPLLLHVLGAMLLVGGLTAAVIAFVVGWRNDPGTLSRLIEEPSGETLAVALRALKASSADALSILMLMKPAVGLDVATFDSMARFYAALKPEDCRAVIDAARANARHMPLTSPEAFGSNEAARRDFGRRSQRPAAREAKG